MNCYEISVLDEQTGEETIYEGGSLADLAEQLRADGYDAGSITVHTEQGFVAGWVGAAGYWRAA